MVGPQRQLLLLLVVLLLALGLQLEGQHLAGVGHGARVLGGQVSAWLACAP